MVTMEKNSKMQTVGNNTDHPFEKSKKEKNETSYWDQSFSW